jgi:hypothetical protein
MLEKFKIRRKSLFNYSLYSHPEIGKFQGVTRRCTGEGEEVLGAEEAWAQGGLLLVVWGGEGRG